MDNYATYKGPKIKAWLAAVRITMSTSRRLRRHGSIRSSAGSLSSTKNRLRRGVHTSVRQLKADMRSFIDRRRSRTIKF